MAAITIRLEQPAQQEIKAERVAGLSDIAPALDKSHAELTNMVYLRAAVLKALEGRSVHVQTSGRDVWLYLDKPLRAQDTPAWNPISLPEVKRGKLLSWTSKMGTPSFSLPAGAPSMGGSCVGANGGQTVVSPGVYNGQKKTVLKVLGLQDYEAENTVCQHCYAEGGQYATGNVQVYQLMRQAWATAAVQDGSFVETMSWAIRNANFYISGKGLSTAKDDDDKLIIDAGTGLPLKSANRGERDLKRYFRIHDSGDFFSPDYIAAWKAVADANPDVTFWAPSRVWAVDRMRAAVNEINKNPKNLIIRPSSYTINGPAPRDIGPGWAGGSTVFAEDAKVGQKDFDWDCRAYLTDTQKVTCRDAEAPDGERGCRACWKRPDLRINYTLH